MNKLSETINDLDHMIERAITIKEECNINNPSINITLLDEAITKLQAFQNSLFGKR